MAHPYPTYVFTAVLSPKSTEAFGSKISQSTVGIQNPNQTVTQSATLKTISTWLPASVANNVQLQETGTITLYGKEAIAFNALYGSSGLNWFTKTQS